MGESTLVITTKRVLLAAILDLLITGVGHMSIHYVKRGIIILLSAIAITIGVFFFFCIFLFQYQPSKGFGFGNFTIYHKLLER